MYTKNSTDTIVEKMANYRELYGELLFRNSNSISPSTASQISSETVRIFEHSLVSDTISNDSRDKIKKYSEIIRQTIIEHCQLNNINLPYSVFVSMDAFEETKSNDNSTIFTTTWNIRYTVNVILSKDFDNVGEIMAHIALKHGIVLNELNLWSKEVQNMLMNRYKVSDAYNFNYNFDLNDEW